MGKGNGGDFGDGDHLAFVVGHYKSGSTWLANLLSLHPSTCGVSETHIFRLSEKFLQEVSTENLRQLNDALFSKVAWSGGGVRKLPRHWMAEWLQWAPWRRKPAFAVRDRPTMLLDLPLARQFALRRMLSQIDNKSEYIINFFKFIYINFDCTDYLVEKTPTNIHFVPTVATIFPNAKLISIRRDGRDVVVSDRFFSVNAGVAWDFERSVHKWREAMEADLKCCEKYNIYICEYGKFMNNSFNEVYQILTYLGLGKSDDIINEMILRSSFEYRTGRKSGQERRDNFYRKGIAGDWVNHFTDEYK